MKLAYVPPMFMAICWGVAFLKCFLFIMNYFLPSLGGLPVIMLPPVNLKKDTGDDALFLWASWTLELEDLREEPNELMLLFESCLKLVGTITG